ncbi:hypothetical protein CSKR_203978 [Clonorchis sinensis]|uniref:Uncharacterized protein n=1 Tax=Clonorchis sinensis TaxID=79923 RepID=A0A8T1MQ53_CLOSI|nr:hypothetical protein CSKR_203978 [Clonorchis sinensis]
MPSGTEGNEETFLSRVKNRSDIQPPFNQGASFGFGFDGFSFVFFFIDDKETTKWGPHVESKHLVSPPASNDYLLEIVVNTCLRRIAVPWCFHSVHTTPAMAISSTGVPDRNGTSVTIQKFLKDYRIETRCG